MSVRKKDGTLSVYKSSSMKFICMRDAIDRFLRSLPFPLSLTPLLLRQIKHQSICKKPQKNGQYCRRTRAKKR